MPIKIETMMGLLPIVFMIHDFEEIIMMKPWIVRNAGILEKRYPRLSARLLPYYQNLSTSSFAFAVALIFIFLSAVTFISIEYSLHAVWLSFLLIFLLHFFIHIGQFFHFGGYVPVIVTSIIGLAYSLPAVIYFISYEPQAFSGLWYWLPAAILISAPLFMIFLRLAGSFEKWLKAYSAP